MFNFLKSIFGLAKTFILSLFLICLVIFMVNNRDVITIHTHPFPFEIEIRIFVLMLFFFLFGMLFGFLAFSKNMLEKSWSNFKDHWKIRGLERKNRKLEKKVEKISNS